MKNGHLALTVGASTFSVVKWRSASIKNKDFQERGCADWSSFLNGTSSPARLALPTE